MTSLLQGCRTQSILMLVQASVVIGGSLLTRVVLKTFGYPQVVARNWGFPVFVRDWALLLLLIPVGWCFTTLWAEEKTDWWSQRATIISGIMLLGVLAFMIFLSLVSASSPHWGGVIRSRG